jgi:hypothetical protein
MVQKAGRAAGKAPFRYPAIRFSTLLEKKLGRCLLLTINERNIAAFLLHSLEAKKSKQRLWKVEASIKQK